MKAQAGAALVLGTRASALARWQAEHVQALLAAAGVSVMLREMTTTGDRILDVPLADIGDKGLFTKELDVALLDGRIDAAVHSLKDLPTQLPPGLVLAAVTAREEPWDAFVAHPSFAGRLEDLPEGAVLGTSSLRRQAQLKAWRADLRVEPVRGNVDTRLAKLDRGTRHGLVLAAAGLLRLGHEARIRARIDPSIMLPAVGQGALAVGCAAEDPARGELLHRVLNHPPTAVAVRAERALLRCLEGGCQVPVAAWGRLAPGGQVVLDGCVASLDGRVQVRAQHSGDAAAPETVGETLAERLLAAGGKAILDEIRRSDQPV